MTADAGERCLVIATGHALSLALLDGARVVSAHHDELGRGHAEALMPLLQQMLELHGGSRPGIRRIIVETGPGSFTGLRIGFAAATALGLAWHVPVSGVRSTRLALAGARGAGLTGPLLAALLAPRGQIWCERFGADDQSSGLPVAFADARAAIAGNADCTIIGSAAHLLTDGTADADQASLTASPQAAWFSHIADQPPEPATLLYVRPPATSGAPDAAAASQTPG